MARTRTTDAPLVVYGANVVRELLAGDAPVERVALLGAAPATRRLQEAARRRAVACDVVDRHALDRLAGTTAHQGAVAVAPAFSWTPVDGLAHAPGLLLLDGVQDPRNFGAILRTARAAGVGGVIIPQDRSVAVTPVVVAASAGTVFGVRLARVPNLVRAMEQIKNAGAWTVGLVPQGGTDLYRLDLPPRVALVVGGEGEGLRRLVRESCDYAATIPMVPGVESLNVSVATGVALFELRRRGALSAPA